MKSKTLFKFVSSGINFEEQKLTEYFKFFGLHFEQSLIMEVHAMYYTITLLLWSKLCS